jgi:hypothetical protein
VVTLALGPGTAACVLGAPPGASAQCFGGWSTVGSPAVVQLGGYHAIQASFRDPAGQNGTLVVFCAVDDLEGGTVGCSTATNTAEAGADGTAYLAPFGLPPR